MSADARRKRKATITKSDETLLAQLGYKQEFQRAFKPLEWAVASTFILIVGLSMAELASAAPTSGGLYFWTHSYSSPEWRNLLAWIVGYANTIGTIASLASIDWGAAIQIMAAAGIGSNGSFTTSRSKTLLCFAVIIALPTATPRELKNSASYALGNFTNSYDWPNGFAFILSFLAPVWTICSFDSSVHISEEASNAATAVPWAIVWAISIAGILGLAVNMTLAFCMGQDLQGLMNSSLGQPMAQILLNSFGKTGTLVMWSFIILAQYMMGSSMTRGERRLLIDLQMLAASRQSFAFARDGALPFSSWLYRMNNFTKTPVNTVWFCAAGSIALGALVFAGTQAVNAVFSISITALYVAYSIPITARWIWRKENGWTPGAFSLGAWSGPCALVSVTWMTFISVVFFFPTTKHTNTQAMNYTVVVLGGLLILPLAWYYFPIYGGVHWFEGPVPTVDGHVRRKWVAPQDVGGVEREKEIIDIEIRREVAPER
ncbi:amino acid permease-domain-containing protein [Lactifluus subvellereus]|nr:amino acid permease-domain-containing protein [Lactifluus subvellereus]